MRTGLTLIKESDGIKFYGEINATDLIYLNLDNVDQALMDNCSHNAHIEDQLLVLEMLFRRINEQRRKKVINE